MSVAGLLISSRQAGRGDQLVLLARLQQGVAQEGKPQQLCGTGGEEQALSHSPGAQPVSL